MCQTEDGDGKNDSAREMARVTDPNHRLPASRPYRTADSRAVRVDTDNIYFRSNHVCFACDI